MRIFAALLRKFALALGTVLAVSFAIFLATELIPTDPAIAALGKDSTEAQRDLFRERANLDQPLVERYLHWLGGALHGDFGQSVITGENITHQVLVTTGRTLLLAFLSLTIGVVIALILALITARPGGVGDVSISAASIIIVSAPEFVLATGAVWLFAIQLGWFPVVSLGVVNGDWSALILPVFTLAVGVVAYIYRIARASLADCLAAPYIQFATLKGYTPTRILLRHALPNAAIVILNGIAIFATNLIGGVIVFETVFAYPGLGRLLVSAIGDGDVTLTCAIGTMLAVLFVTINLIADSLVIALSPRLRRG